MKEKTRAGLQIRFVELMNSIRRYSRHATLTGVHALSHGEV